MTQPFDAIWIALGPVEGGYSFDPNDPGGETMFGITALVARAHGYKGPMKDLPRDTAKAIAQAEFYTPLNLDQVGTVSWPLAAELFDIAFNMGPWKARIWLHRSLNALATVTSLPLDAPIGKDTLAALAGFARARPGGAAAAVLLKCLAAYRCVDYIDQELARPSDREFIYGWIAARVRQDGIQLPA